MIKSIKKYRKNKHLGFDFQKRNYLPGVDLHQASSVNGA